MKLGKLAPKFTVLAVLCFLIVQAQVFLIVTGSRAGMSYRRCRIGVEGETSLSNFVSCPRF
ncbi:hypothetical protein DRP04_13005 [Archaeoglobales archaeon]|nr:MAG: hypothetical protein DRP04_13005 [Archaeoglobales archaeon]